MKEMIFTLIYLLLLGSIQAQQIDYFTTNTSSANVIGTSVTVLSGTVTLTKTGPISVVANLSILGAGDCYGQIYIDGDAISTQEHIILSNIGMGGQVAGNMALSGRYTGYAVGSHTVSIICSGSGGGGVPMNVQTASELVILENEDPVALASEVASITSANQLADNQFQALIDALTARVTTLESSMTTALGDISTLQDQTSTLQNQTSTLQGQISTLQTQMTTANDSITGNTTEIENLKSQISSLQSRPDSSKQQNDDLSKIGVGLGAAGLGSLFGYLAFDSFSSNTAHIRQILSK